MTEYPETTIVLFQDTLLFLYITLIPKKSCAILHVMKSTLPQFYHLFLPVTAEFISTHLHQPDLWQESINCMSQSRFGPKIIRISIWYDQFIPPTFLFILFCLISKVLIAKFCLSLFILRAVWFVPLVIPVLSPSVKFEWQPVFNHFHNSLLLILLFILSNILVSWRFTCEHFALIFNFSFNHCLVTGRWLST